MKRATGSGGVGLSYTDERYGEAFEREQDESEYGLPEQYSDLNDYRPKSPVCDLVIGQ